MTTNITETDMLDYIKLKDSYDVNDVKIVLCYGNFDEYSYDFMKYMLKIVGKDVGDTLLSHLEPKVTDRIYREDMYKVIGKGGYYSRVIDFINVYVVRLAEEVARLTIEESYVDASVSSRGMKRLRVLTQTTFKGSNEWVRMNNQLIKTFYEVYTKEVGDDVKYKLRVAYVSGGVLKHYDREFDGMFNIT